MEHALGNDQNPENNWTCRVELRTNVAFLGINNFLSGLPIDSDFRAEPLGGVELSPHSLSPFCIRPGQSLFQLIFRGPGGRRFPNLVQVSSMSELSETTRGSNCHGWTGIP